MLSYHYASSNLVDTFYMYITTSLPSTEARSLLSESGFTSLIKIEQEQLGRTTTDI